LSDGAVLRIRVAPEAAIDLVTPVAVTDLVAPAWAAPAFTSLATTAVGTRIRCTRTEKKIERGSILEDATLIDLEQRVRISTLRH